MLQTRPQTRKWNLRQVEDSRSTNGSLEKEDLDGVGKSEMENFSVTVSEAQNNLTFEEEEPGDPELNLDTDNLDQGDTIAKTWCFSFHFQGSFTV